MNNDQQRRDQQQSQVPQQQVSDPRAGLVQKGALAAIGGAFSGAARALMAHMLGDGS